VETITAVLRREPDAVTGVRARLEELRERAAGALAFELPGVPRGGVAGGHPVRLGRLRPAERGTGRGAVV